MKKQMICIILSSVLILSGLIGRSSLCMAYSGEDQKVLVLKSGNEQPAGAKITQACFRFAERMEQRTNGKIRITHFSDAQLGNWRQMVELVKTGAIGMVISQGTGSKAEIVSLPYLYRDLDHATKVLDGEIIKDWAKKHLEVTGIYIFGWVYRGFRHCTFRQTAVRTPADMKGIKIRAPLVPEVVEMFRALGARPTTIPLSEVYLGLSQGVVDGQESALDDAINMSLWEVSKYLVLTRHNISIGWGQVSRQVWQSLTPETKNVWLTTWKEVAEEIKKEVVKEQEELMSLWKSKGGIVVEPDVEAFRAVCKSVWKKFEEKYGPQVIEGIDKTR